MIKLIECFEAEEGQTLIVAAHTVVSFHPQKDRTLLRLVNGTTFVVSCPWKTFLQAMHTRGEHIMITRDHSVLGPGARSEEPRDKVHR